MLIIVIFLIKHIAGPGIITELMRAPYGGETRIFSAQIDTNFKGETGKKNVDITIRPEGLTEDEKIKRVEITKKNLGYLILGQNDDLDHVTSSLDLVMVDFDTGVEVAWKSENDEILDDDGNINLLIVRENDRIGLDADLRLDEITDSVRFDITFGKPVIGSALTDAIDASVDNTVKDIYENNQGKIVNLPTKTSDGVSLIWYNRSSSEIFMQILVILIIASIVYLSRYNSINKKIEEIKDSMSRDFPEFINKLVLLLNAGMIVTTAFEKITEDYNNRINKNEKKHLYEELCMMDQNIKSANIGFLSELNKMTGRSGVRDLMRFNSIIVDNIDKGSTLVDKLQSECDLLWSGRIKSAEEKGRLAETKLTFPMVLQLLVLIIITIAPAAMEM